MELDKNWNLENVQTLKKKLNRYRLTYSKSRSGLNLNSALVILRKLEWKKLKTKKKLVFRKIENCKNWKSKKNIFFFKLEFQMNCKFIKLAM